MKKITLFLVVLMSALSVCAKSVDPHRQYDMAAKAALLLYMEQHPYMQKQEVKVGLTYDRRIASFDNVTLYFVDYFLHSQVIDHGFIVVSSDENVSPVLAFSTECYADTDKQVHPAMQAMLQQYDQQIAAAKAKGIVANAANAAKWAKIESINSYARVLELMPKGDMYNDNIPQLLGSMRWGQGKPYNDKCPGNSVTGCVATAFGMIMNYWNYPEHGFGRHAYNGVDNPAAYGNWTYGIQSAEFETTYYDWDNIPDNLMINSPETEIEATSTLLHQIGVALEMNYNPNGSGCWSLPEYALFDTSLHLSTSICANNCIPRHFGYKFSYSGMRDSIGNDSLWLSMLYTSLSEGKPIYYAGWARENNEAGHSATNGHGYILDGYFSDLTDSNYFHINWGWSGSYDGFFKIDAMTPSGSDFTQWHGAIIGLEPDTSYHGYPYLGVNQALVDAPMVTVEQNHIQVVGCQNMGIQVFDIMGRLVSQRVACAQNTFSAQVCPGVYVVRVGGFQGKKVIIM